MAFARQQRKRSSAIPTDSVSDIAFLLIIFFILTTTIRKLSGFSSELPAGQKTQVAQSERTPTVVLSESSLRYNDDQVSLQQLKDKLASLKLADKNGSDKIVLLEATAGVSYQDYFDVMASVGAAGGVVGIVTDDKGAKK